jgi:curved DNA-binding protein CbpA
MRFRQETSLTTDSGENDPPFRKNWMLFLAVGLISPSLQPGDDLYRILGLSSTQSTRCISHYEIYRADSQLRKVWHPDACSKSKQTSPKECSEQFIRVCDASKVLLNRTRRLWYHNYNRWMSDSPLPGASAAYGFDVRLITTANLASTLEEFQELVVFVHDGGNSSATRQQSEAYETAACHFVNKLTFFHADIASDGLFGERFGHDVPYLLHLALDRNNTEQRSVGRAPNSVEDIHLWLLSLWDAEVPIFRRIGDLTKWLHDPQGFIQIVQFEVGQHSWLNLKKLAMQHPGVKFALWNGGAIEAIRAFGLTKYPTMAAFERFHKMDFKTIDELPAPHLAKFEPKFLRDICFESCLVYFGTPHPGAFGSRGAVPMF